MTIPTRSRSAERLVDILLELHLHGVVNRQALMHKFNITERTVYRDLNALSPIVEHTGEGQYRLIHAPQGHAGPGLHHVIANFLNVDDFFPDKGREFWEKLESRAEDNHIMILGNDAERKEKWDIHAQLAAFEKAIQHQQVCQILYKGKSRQVNPYKVINKKNIWYLQATEDGRLKSFSLSLIQWLDIRSETFTPDNDTLELLEKNPDPWVSEETFEVNVFIPGTIAHYFKRRDLLPGQEILAEDKQGLTLRCHAAHENQILPLLFYWLPNIQVLEPAWLKQKFVATLENYLTDVA
ncbi:WYL domain-containing protein [Leclercia adecarboxylata]|uniref:helix-turn-helix transcriptional regulator n=1 Tax=Leclercia adecarboxylata TaxID=83655 RepID=UPI002DBF35E8|nr:WYL domain-containing protein [Leclercia adecarboxylata]MEB6379751.1 WYL domain-containing protein [Leclercia adecarboxylata]